MQGNTEIINGSSNVLLQYGIAGVFIIFLIVCLVIVWKAKSKSDADLLAEKEKRIADAKEVTATISTPIQQQTQLSEKIYDLLVGRTKGL